MNLRDNDVLLSILDGFRKIRNSFSRQKFTLSRGQSYVSLVFWAITIANVVMLNVKDYFKMAFHQYILVSAIGVLGIMFTVWFIGYMDIKLRLYSTEKQYAETLTPIVKETYDNTQLILEKIDKK